MSAAGVYVYTPGVAPKTADYDGDGRHGDGKAGDSVYSATLAVIQRGAYLLRAKAVIPGAGAIDRYAQTTVQ